MYLVTMLWNDLCTEGKKQHNKQTKYINPSETDLFAVQVFLPANGGIFIIDCAI